MSETDRIRIKAEPYALEHIIRREARVVRPAVEREWLEQRARRDHFATVALIWGVTIAFMVTAAIVATAVENLQTKQFAPPSQSFRPKK